MLTKGSLLKKQYEIFDVLTQGTKEKGGFYRARDSKRGFYERNEVAIKEIHRGNQAARDITMDFLRRQALALMRIRHAYLPRILDVFIEGEFVYFVEEFVQGETLEQFLKKGDRVKPLKAAETALRVIEILDFLHENMVYYRDLKPSNLIVQPGRLFLVNLAGCQIRTQKSGLITSIRNKGYSPPESFDSEKANKIDASYDVYSVGMLLYRMVTGLEIEEFSEAPPPLDAERDRIPIQLVRLINKATATSSFSRFHTMWEMRLELEKVVELLRKAAAAAIEKTGTADSPFSSSIPFKYQLFSSIKFLCKTTFDILIFLLIPVMIIRPDLAGHSPLAVSGRHMHWFQYIVAVLVIMSHSLYRHWLDWYEPMANFNRFLFMPIHKVLGTRPINWLLIIEFLLMLYLILSILTG